MTTLSLGYLLPHCPLLSSRFYWLPPSIYCWNPLRLSSQASAFVDFSNFIPPPVFKFHFSLPKPLLQAIRCLIYLSSQQILRHTRLLKFSISKIKLLNPPYPPLNLFSLNVSISGCGNSILPAPEPSWTLVSLYLLHLIHQPILLAAPSASNQNLTFSHHLHITLLI